MVLFSFLLELSSLYFSVTSSFATLSSSTISIIFYSYFFTLISQASLLSYRPYSLSLIPLISLAFSSFIYSSSLLSLLKSSLSLLKYYLYPSKKPRFSLFYFINSRSVYPYFIYLSILSLSNSASFLNNCVFPWTSSSILV